MSAKEQNLKVLIVEDSPADIALFETFFTQEMRKCEFQIAQDGERAIELLSPSASGDQPDLVVLDINLPKIDGKDVLKEIKANPGSRRIPVVVLTSSESEDDIRLSYEYGASCVLIKPCDVAGVRFLFRSLESFWVNCVRYPSTLAS